MITSCDFNPLGGSKSHLDPTFEPGKHQASAPPVIGAVANFTMDENDIQTIPFTISDPDTFMVCSLIFVKTATDNGTLIDSTGLTIGGTYPNCTLRIAPKAFQFGVSNITLSVYDFWTSVSTTFQLTVLHILTPGVFTLTDVEGGDSSVDATWTNAAYMSGSSAFYTIYYQQVSPLGGLQSIPNVHSPFTVPGLTNGVDYDFYVVATNSIGSRQSNTVRAQPGKFQNRGGSFIAGSTQFELTPGSAGPVHMVSASLLPEVPVADANYPALDSSYTLSEVPVNGNFPVGTPPSSAVLTPSGKYKVYVNSQSNILAGTNK